MPNFEVFTRRSSRPSATEAMMTIQKRGTFSLNRAAFEGMGEPEAVELLYDGGERLIGLRPVAASVKHAYPVRKQPNAASYLLAGNAFCAHHGIPVGESRRYNATIVEGMMVVDLKQEPQQITSTRKPRTQSQRELVGVS